MDTGGDAEHVTGLVNTGFEGYIVDSVTAVKQLSYKFIQVREDGSVVPVHKEEIMKTKSLPVNVQTDRAFVDDDDALYFNIEEADGYLAIGDVPCAFDNYIGKVDCNVLDSANAHGGKQAIEHEYVDGMCGGATDEGTLHLASDCQDNLLGTASARSPQLNCASYYGSQRENMSSKCEDQCLGKSLNPVKVSDFIVPKHAFDNKPMLQDDMCSQELHDAFKSSFEQDTCVNDKEWLRHRILFGLQNFTEKDSVPGLFESELPWQENEDSMILIPGNDLARSMCCSLINAPEKKLVVGRSIHQDGHLTEDTVVAALCEVDGTGSVPVTKNAVVCRKRSRNPPVRYIEETLGTDDQYQWRAPEMLSMVDQVVAAVVPRRRRVQRVCPNKNINFIMNGFGGNKAQVLSVNSVSADTSRSESCDDATYYASLDESSDDSIETFRNFRTRKNSSRRKNHRQWTLSEITKLIEGVSQCGVGKWTDIKRLLFATSSYRTSVDLKDKWRNLLRASGVPMRSRKQVKPQKNMTVPIPQSILRRVKELANIHPYPRGRKFDVWDDETSVSQSSKASN